MLGSKRSWAPSVFSMKSLALMMRLDLVVEVASVRWFMSADIRQAQRWPPEATICSRNSGTSGTSSSAIDFFSFEVAMAVIPGSPPRPCGMWVAVLPSIVNFRSPIVFLLIMSKPQNVKNRWVSTPSPRAALARIRAG